MFRTALSGSILFFSDRSAWIAAILFGTNLLFNVVANSSFKLSVVNPTWRGFLGWQVAGNLAGLATVLTLTALLRHYSLHVAYLRPPDWR